MNEEVRKFLAGIEEEMGGLPRDIHITRMCSSLVAVSNGKVIKLTDPKLEHCPLASSLYDFPRGLDMESLKARIAEAVERKISEFGLFTDLRPLYRSTIAIPFGASEMMMYDLKRGRAEAAVVVCDGAGTVIADDPYLVQGIGARMNGVFYTSPIKGVIKGIEDMGGEILFPDTAKIDQVSGVRRALERYGSIDVTVSGFGNDGLREIRELEAESGASVTILVVCTTGMGEGRVKEAMAYADLVWSCASGKVREAIGRRAKLQMGTKIPVYALTERALDFVSSYSSREFREYVSKFDGPYIISGGCRTMPDAHECMRIKMGDFDTYIARVKSLPIRSADEPRPLL
ncbi:MAG: DUF2099 family protein [Candidatus Bathyarchaeia archaeon]